MRGGRAPRDVLRTPRARAGRAPHVTSRRCDDTSVESACESATAADEAAHRAAGHAVASMEGIFIRTGRDTRAALQLPVFAAVPVSTYGSGCDASLRKSAQQCADVSSPPFPRSAVPLRGVLRSKGFVWLDSDDAHSHYWRVGSADSRTHSRTRHARARARAHTHAHTHARKQRCVSQFRVDGWTVASRAGFRAAQVLLRIPPRPRGVTSECGLRVSAGVTAPLDSYTGTAA